MFSAQTGKIVTADQNPIDLSLTKTCRLVTSEMRGLTFKLNTITFTTIYNNELHETTAWWHALLDALRTLKHRFIVSACGLIDSAVANELLKLYPEFRPVIRGLQGADGFELADWDSFAIRYLQSLSPEVRKQIRNVVLEEDRMSVAGPQGHAQGLIPLCLENPLLRVEQKVNLWENILFSNTSTVPW
ncbi:hypothetical protein EK21DRAFT_118982 [Setomelanomma holmii]|uniref:Uncharacterized protein n=1 Tax=Setomelanomma holmii TaxID=210430 RepID=A0A9P4GY00_9PLEO|nr:hypothetical protein EK21DRAFT_118982 [Setomelanomma holmii]